jgi:metacaspase-1
MTHSQTNHVFLSYNDANHDVIEALARRLQGDARLSFWFAPWHSVPGVPLQEQMEQALRQAQACAVFIDSASQIVGWQNEQMRTAIQTRVEDESNYRIIPVLLPGATRPSRRDLPAFLRRYELVEFHSPDDTFAFKRLLGGILGIPPIQVDGYIEVQANDTQLVPPSATFTQGHAVVVGIANYAHVSALPEVVLKDARDLAALLVDTASCGYPAANVVQLLDHAATGAGIHTALDDLATRTGPDDTAIVFFSGHGAHAATNGFEQQYLLPYDCQLTDLPGTALNGTEITGRLCAITAGRLLVFFDCCHSGGIGNPKGALSSLRLGLSQDYYAALAQGTGRVVIASSRPDELSWMLPGMDNSLFTHYILEALRGQAKTLGDGYVRVFDLFRHVADAVPAKANQHPVFKATAMETDFPVALTRNRT